MDLSDKMPAQQDSTLAARMPAKMTSDAPAYAGEGGSDDAAAVTIVTESAPQEMQWMPIDRERGLTHETADRTHGPKIGWETTDRTHTPEGGLPQRDPDNDGDLN